MQPDGSYLYEDSKMQKAINWCQNRTRNALLQGHNVVVANTFCRGLEWECYVGMAINLGANLRFVEAVGCYKSVHNVPVERIERMRARWETLPGVFEKTTTLT